MGPEVSLRRGPPASFSNCHTNSRDSWCANERQYVCVHRFHRCVHRFHRGRRASSRRNGARPFLQHARPDRDGDGMAAVDATKAARSVAQVNFDGARRQTKTPRDFLARHALRREG